MVTEGMEAITSAALGLALDAASLRQQVIAANIANAQTDGYVPLDVDFDRQLADARRTWANSGSVDAASLRDVAPRLVRAAAPDAAHAGLDMQVAALAQNGVHFQTLLKALSKHYALLEEAVSDGKK
ncbi:flagellar basal body rod protein FlgB [Trinickia diaoshuihuensis]|uniref:flagellar basal body rod protein FlgB n=1 Tax=Trinickia diaoshuihuensis TaxID=2292265 RepID=UPI001F071A9C|nr:flagellar basal body protein [Trinickia diaoshuihuensis]